MRLSWIFLVLIFLPLIVEAQPNIRKIDFKNFTYFAYCADEDPIPIRVVNGDFLHRGTNSAFDYLHFWVRSIEFGDLDGDSIDEAVVVTVCHPGGTGKFSEGYIFSPGRLKPKLIGRFPGGDRAAGGIASVFVKDGLLTIERNEEDEGGLCCPNHTITQTYRFARGELKEIGNGIRKELYSPKRIEIPELGKPIVFAENIDYLQRYIVSGAEGQILTVTTNLADAPIYQYKSGDRIEDGVVLKTRFRPNEDIIFGIYNNAEFPRVFEITVRIDDRSNSTGGSSEKTESHFFASLFTYEIFDRFARDYPFV